MECVHTSVKTTQGDLCVKSGRAEVDVADVRGILQSGVCHLLLLGVPSTNLNMCSRAPLDPEEYPELQVHNMIA